MNGVGLLGALTPHSEHGWGASGTWKDEHG